MRLSGRTLATLDAAGRDALVAQVAGVAERKAWRPGRTDQPWEGARLTSAADVDEVLAALAVDAGHVVVSVAAGVTTARIEAALAPGVPVVRVMPNTPMLVNEAMSAVSAGRYVGDEQLQAVVKILQTVGRVTVVPEKQMDAVTAVSGSGPAYVFLLAEAMIDAFASREQITFWEALRRAEEAPGVATRSLNSIRSFVEMIEEVQSMVEAGERADVVLETVLERSGYLKELEDSEDPQDETRLENLAELVAVAREFADDPLVGPSADPADPDLGAAPVTDDEIAAIQADPAPYGKELAAEYGWGADQWSCLVSLWIGESNWDYSATNPSSGAYGIPQSLPASKMASAGPDWKTNPVTQMIWGMDYIKASYGSPCQAKAFWDSNNPHWY